MEPLFTNHCVYTKQNLIESNKSVFLHKSVKVVFICIGLLIFLGGLLAEEYADCLFGIFFCAIYPLYLKWAVRYSAEKKYQQLQQLYHSEAESITSYYEDRLVVHQMLDNSDATVAYSQIAKVYETKNLFYLTLSTGIGFMMDKQGFVGTTTDEFDKFIREHAVGEGQIDLKKKKRKYALIMGSVLLGSAAIGIAIAFLGESIENIIPKTFTYSNYSIKLTSAFDDYDDEWDSSDVTVYCFNETSKDLSSDGLVYDTAAAYLKDTNESSGINSAVTAESDTNAWTTYTNTSDGNEYYNYDYVIESDGEFWYTEFYCLAEDADKYAPLFEKWAKTIIISSPK